jgi:hypothetical protein
MVSEVLDPRENIPRYVVAHRQGAAPWIRVWEHRDKLETKLAVWMRSLSDEGTQPVAKPLIGRQCALDEDAAHLICRLRLEDISRMSGCPDGWADFWLNERPVNCGRRGRPCTIIEDGQVKTYPSVSAAARAEGLTRSLVAKRVLEGREYRDGRIVV